MARRKLIDYLNNPMLLKDISMEEMKAWADDAPYAGLIQKLLAQKLIIEKASQKEIDAAKAMSILSNANPKYVLRSIDDFKRMILEGEKVEDQSAAEIPLGISAHSVSDQVAASADPNLGALEKDQKETSIEEDAAEADKPEPNEDQIAEEETVDEVVDDTPAGEDDSSEDDSTSFTSWLSTLSAIHIEEKMYDINIELDDDAPVSDTLAQLLVKQGHIADAIEMYEKLILKYPQKSSFFAAQISKLKEL